MQFDRPVLLYGAGREGRSTYAYIRQQSPQVQIAVTSDKDDGAIEGAETIANADLAKALAAGKFGLVVKSPGVPLSNPNIVAAIAAGVPVTSNVNLWGAAFRAGRKVIAITGTKGKSTSATLLAGMLTQSGIPTGLGGNVGVPPLELGGAFDTVVLELSSFQTANLDFAPDYAGLTNLYPEHFDWHGSTERYMQDKLRLLRLEPLAKVALGPQAAVHPLLDFIRANPNRLVPDLDAAFETEFEDAVTASRLKGRHNFHNGVLAARLALAAGATLDGILAGVEAFEPLPHRLQESVFGGMVFVDDSIATTPEATKAALAAYAGRRIALIAGGYDRGQDFDELARMLGNAGVSVLACLPENGARIAATAREETPLMAIIEVPELKQALRTLFDRRRDFDVVLLSPGAPSFNQFRDYAERGDRFIALARDIFGPNA